MDTNMNADTTFKLRGTELDDVKTYQHAQTNTIDTFPYGHQLKLIQQPSTLDCFNTNFRVFCKYGLNSLIIDYFDESCKDYAKILNKLFDENDKRDTIGTIWDSQIINVLAQYLKAPFTIFDLFRTHNRFNETGMTLAAKYGQSATVAIIIKYAKKFNVIQEIINHKANGGTALFWLFRCYSTAVFKVLDDQDSIRPTMMLLLKNGATVAPSFQYGFEFINVMQLAQTRKKILESEILQAYFKCEQKETQSPLEYAKTQENANLINILQAYRCN
eukprot:522756_1